MIHLQMQNDSWIFDSFWLNSRNFFCYMPPRVKLALRAQSMEKESATGFWVEKLIDSLAYHIVYPEFTSSANVIWYSPRSFACVATTAFSKQSNYLASVCVCVWSNDWMSEAFCQLQLILPFASAKPYYKVALVGSTDLGMMEREFPKEKLMRKSAR